MAVTKGDCSGFSQGQYLVGITHELRAQPGELYVLFSVTCEIFWKEKQIFGERCLLASFGSQMEGVRLRIRFGLESSPTCMCVRCLGRDGANRVSVNRHITAT